MRKQVFLLSLLSFSLMAPVLGKEPSWSESPETLQLQKLIAKDASQKQLDQLLSHQAEYGMLNTVRFLVAQGARINPPKDSYEVPLLSAIRGQKTEITAWLLEQGADPNIYHDSGSSAMYFASLNAHPDIAQLLLKKGVTIDLVDNKGATPLFYAAQEGNTALLEFFVSQGARLDGRDKEGNTALAWAFAGGEAKNIEYLLSRGLKIKTLNHKGENALFMAVYEHRDELVKSFSQYAELEQIDINQPSLSGDTLLHVAMRERSYELARLLLHQKANPQLKNKQGETPISLLLANLKGTLRPAEFEELEAALSKQSTDRRSPLLQNVLMLRTRISDLKANMHSLQTALETYAVDWDGNYPKNIAELHAEAIRQNYWQDFPNPFSDKFDLSDVLLDDTGSEPGLQAAGKVIYQPFFEQGKVTHYKIYAVDRFGHLILDKGQAFYLSNR